VTPAPAAPAPHRQPFNTSHLDDVLGTTSTDDTDDRDLDPCQAMVWRLSVLTDPPPLAEDLE
jgi:hypothetical protein